MLKALGVYRQWPELLGWLWSAASNNDAAVREVRCSCYEHLYTSATLTPRFVLSQIGLYTLYCILDTIVLEDFTAQLPQLLGLFQKTLNDPENLGIRIITLRALGKIAEYISVEDKEQVVGVRPDHRDRIRADYHHFTLPYDAGRRAKPSS